MKRGLVLLASLPLLLAADGGIPELLLPVDCKLGQSCFIQQYVDADLGPGIRDYHCGRRTSDRHDGIDFRLRSMVQQRAGVQVLAAADGTVAHIRDGMRDVSVAVAGKASVADKECGNAVQLRHGGDVRTVYCHMGRGSVLVKPGQRVRAGEPLGKVGMSGSAEFPHLHFVVWQGRKPVDPFAYGGDPRRCNGGRSLWAPSTGLAQAYRAGEVINAGFAAGPVTVAMAQERGDHQQPRPARSSPQLVAFIQAIGLEAGDVQLLTVKAPDGSVHIEDRDAPLDADKAQWVMFAGRKLRAAAWPAGHYSARYQLLRGGRVVVDRRFGIALD